MKTKALFLGIIGLGMAMSSCNLDNDNDSNYMTGTYDCCNLVIPADGGNASASAGSYNMAFYYMSGTMTAATSNLNLGFGTFGFTTNEMDSETRYYDVNGKTLDVTSFSGGMANSNGISVQNLKGYLTSIVNLLNTNDPVNPAYKFIGRVPVVMSYTVNYDYTVKTFMPDAIYSGTTHIATAGSTEEPYTNPDIRYRVIFDTDFKKADIIFYDAKFSPMMPRSIYFVLQDLNVEFTKNGYKITGKDLIPDLYEANGLTPAPNYPFTEFEFINTSDDLTTATCNYTVQIGPAQYYGDFQGYYCLTGKNQE